MKDPAFLFYTNDFIGGVSDLTMEERGQYITLLCLQHQKGHLSEKIIQLNVGNTTVDVLNKFQKDENGLLYNARLDAEIEKRRQHSEKQRANIQKRWSGKDVGIDGGNTVVLPLENENENRNIDVNKDINKEPKKFKKPTVDEINQYASEKNIHVDAERFFNFYESKGWLVGKSPMKNWKAAVSNWASDKKQTTAFTLNEVNNKPGKL